MNYFIGNTNNNRINNIKLSTFNDAYNVNLNNKPNPNIISSNNVNINLIDFENFNLKDSINSNENNNKLNMIEINLQNSNKKGKYFSV